MPCIIVKLMLTLIVAGVYGLLTLRSGATQDLKVGIGTVHVIVSLVTMLLTDVSATMTKIVDFLKLVIPRVKEVLMKDSRGTLMPFDTLFKTFAFLLTSAVKEAVTTPCRMSTSVVVDIIKKPFFVVLLEESGGCTGWEGRCKFSFCER